MGPLAGALEKQEYCSVAQLAVVMGQEEGLVAELVEQVIIAEMDQQKEMAFFLRVFARLIVADQDFLQFV